MAFDNELLSFKPSELSEKEPQTGMVDYFIDDIGYDYTLQRKIYYVSDLHIDHKLKGKFFWQNSKKHLETQIDKIIEQICEDIDLSASPYLLIAGDTSFRYEVNEIFYSKLAALWGYNSNKIVVVLGNHEYWEHSSVEVAKAKYKELFSKLKITYLDNGLLTIIKYGIPKYYSEEELLSISTQKLADICLKSSVNIIGGTGYSIYNSEYNADKKLYCNAIKSLQEEQIYAQKFNRIYNLISTVAQENDNVIVLTHMPKEDWSIEQYNPKWKYVNGHTHKSEHCYSQYSKWFYSDIHQKHLSILNNHKTVVFNGRKGWLTLPQNTLCTTWP